MNAIPTPTTLPLADLDLPPEAARRRRGADQLALLQASMGTLGRLLQPILVTRSGNRHAVIDGTGRVLAARALGWAEIPVHIVDDLSDRDAAAAQVAANTVRAPLALPDQWRAVAGLVDQGWPADQAALAIGLTERQARQCDRLGRLHPDVLAMMDLVDWNFGRDDHDDEDIEPPNERELGLICRIPMDQQAELLKATQATGNHDLWYRLAHKASGVGKSYSRKHALFDVDAAGIAWQQDVFAEPDSPAEWTTTETDAFLEAQETAVLRKVARKPQQHVVKWDTDYQRPDMPAGFREDARGQDNIPALAKTDHRFCFLAIDPDDGRVKWRLGTLPTKATPPEKPAPTAAVAEGADAEADDDADALDESADQLDAPATPAAAKRILTAEGDAMLAKARTDAIRAALRQPDLTVSPDDLVALLVIGLTSRTVAVQDGYGNYGPHVDFRDLTAQLITPEGHLSLTVNPYHLAAEALARMLTLHPTFRDPAAEWIGGAIGALDHLPRLDSEAFLATVAGDALRARAAELGLKLKKVGAIREALAGNDPDWKPAFAHFGTPGPKPAPIALPLKKPEAAHDD